jgi:UDP-N-acetylglucosamine:LPS N-acetylglucosamine transferase
VLIPQPELTPDKLAQAVAELMKDRAKLEKMSTQARRLSHNDAAGRVARMIGELAGKN